MLRFAITANTRTVRHAHKSHEKERAGQWLVVWSFDDVILEPGTALSEQPIG